MGSPEPERGSPPPRRLALAVVLALVVDAALVMAPPPSAAPLVALWRSAHDGVLALAPVLLCGAAAWCAWRFGQAGQRRWALGLTVAALAAAWLAQTLVAAGFAFH
ncbi:MAG: hypothetical protein H6710_10190 [Myxococcales bacterium]|nr:hypothetical protein [Myxococcales bacterium]